MMDVLDELEKRKNQLIFEFLTKLKEDLEDDEKYAEIRVDFLDKMNILYREAVNIIAAQKGVVIQSFEVLAKQLLPKGFKIEDTVKKVSERVNNPRRVGEIDKDD